MAYTSFQQAMAEAYVYYKQLIGPITNGAHNNDVDAFRHAYASAVFTMERGADRAAALGYAHEMYGDWKNNQPAYEKNMDLWNNHVGRDIGQEAASKFDAALGVADALANGDLIENPFTDSYDAQGRLLRCKQAA